MSQPAESNPYAASQAESILEPDTSAVETVPVPVDIMSLDDELLALVADDLKVANRWMIVGIFVGCGLGCLNSLQLLYEFYRSGPGAIGLGTFKLLAIVTQFSGAALILHCSITIAEFVKHSVSERLSLFFQADNLFWKVTGFLFLISLGFSVIGVLCIVYLGA